MGMHTVSTGTKLDCYQDQLLELAEIINGEMENPYTDDEHEYLVHEVTSAASGYTTWRQ